MLTVQFWFHHMQFWFHYMRFWFHYVRFWFHQMQFWFHHVRFWFHYMRFWLQYVQFWFHHMRFWFHHMQFWFHYIRFWFHCVRFWYHHVQVWFHHMRFWFHHLQFWYHHADRYLLAANIWCQHLYNFLRKNHARCLFTKSGTVIINKAAVPAETSFQAELRYGQLLISFCATRKFGRRSYSGGTNQCDANYDKSAANRCPTHQPRTSSIQYPPSTIYYLPFLCNPSPYCIRHTRLPTKLTR